MMSCFLYFSLLSSCCRKAGLEVNISPRKSRAGALGLSWVKSSGSRLMVTAFLHRIVESVGLEKSFKIGKSNH